MKIPSLLGLAALCTFAGTAMAKNPIIKGWYADPEVAVFDKEYWIYPTYSAEYEKQTFLDAFSSKDLVNWTKHERVIDNDAVKWAKQAMWAPCVVEKGGKYYIFFAANDVHEGEIGGIGVGVSDNPGGPFKDLLGKPLINDIVNGAQPIDQAVFKDGNQWYIIYGGWKHCNLAKLKSDFTALEPFDDGKLYKEVTPEGYTEGPLIFKHSGKYYFMWSEGGWGDASYQVAYAIGDSLEGPWKRIGTIIERNPEIATSAGHHSVLKAPDGQWYIVYHRRPHGETGRDSREVAIDKMEFNADGTIKPVIMTTEGVKPNPIK